MRRGGRYTIYLRALLHLLRHRRHYDVVDRRPERCAVLVTLGVPWPDRERHPPRPPRAVVVVLRCPRGATRMVPGVQDRTVGVPQPPLRHGVGVVPRRPHVDWCAVRSHLHRLQRHRSARWLRADPSAAAQHAPLVGHRVPARAPQAHRDGHHGGADVDALRTRPRPQRRGRRILAQPAEGARRARRSQRPGRLPRIRRRRRRSTQCSPPAGRWRCPRSRKAGA